VFAAAFVLFNCFAATRKQGAAVHQLVKLPAGITSDLVIGANHHADVDPKKEYVLVEFGDYQCPPCRADAPQLESLLKRNRAKIQYVFRQFPLIQIHERAMALAQFAEAARLQGKFEGAHEAIYNSKSLSDETLRAIAKALNLQWGRMERDMSTVALERVRSDMEGGFDCGVAGTPGFVLCHGSSEPRAVTMTELQAMFPG
jgi:protein-disulfide isomerase